MIECWHTTPRGSWGSYNLLGYYKKSTCVLLYKWGGGPELREGATFEQNLFSKICISLFHCSYFSISSQPWPCNKNELLQRVQAGDQHHDATSERSRSLSGPDGGSSGHPLILTTTRDRREKRPLLFWKCGQFEILNPSIWAFRRLMGVLVRCQTPPVVSSDEYMEQIFSLKHGEEEDQAASGATGRVGWEAAESRFWEGGGGSNYNILTPGGSTEAEPAVKPNRKIRRGREMAGLPQGGETPLGSSFLKPNYKSFVPTFTFWGQKISTILCLLEC